MSFPKLRRELTERASSVELGAATGEVEGDVFDGRLARAARLASVGNLVAGMGHEIANPVQYISDSIHFLELALVELLSGEVASRDASVAAEVRECLASARDGVARISDLARAMQTIAPAVAEPEGVADINKLVETATVVCRPEWKYVALIQLDLDPETPPLVCRLGEILQALVNIIVNAAQAIREARATRHRTALGTIRIATHAYADRIEITIADDGIGIAAESLAHVLDPFFSTRAASRSAGLGLSVADSVVRLHGGSIQVRSVVERGTDVTVILPLPSLR